MSTSKGSIMTNSNSNVFTNYANGQLSFPFTYWAFGLGGNIVLYLAAMLIGAADILSGPFIAASMVIGIIFGALSFVGLFPLGLVLAISAGAELTLGSIAFVFIWGGYNWIWIKAIWTSGSKYTGNQALVSLARNQTLVLMFLSMMAIVGAFSELVKAIL